MSISWGKTQRVKFAGAWKLETWTPPDLPGLYAITYKQDADNNPTKHTVIYFGQGESLSREGLPWEHEHSQGWINSAGGKGELFIFIHPMPQSTAVDRWRLLDRLVAEYTPQCNRC